MTDEQNLFDLSDLSDLPAEVISQANLRRVSEMQSMVMDLMELAEGSVTANMIMVAIYRKYNKMVKKTVCNSTLAYLASKGELIRLRTGVYKLGDVS